MKKKTVVAMLAGVLGYCHAFGLLINAGNLQKKFTPDDAARLNYMNQGFGVSASRGPVEVRLYRGDTDGEFYFTRLELDNNGSELPGSYLRGRVAKYERVCKDSGRVECDKHKHYCDVFKNIHGRRA